MAASKKNLSSKNILAVDKNIFFRHCLKMSEKIWTDEILMGKKSQLSRGQRLPDTG
jgi:hypothetical protein